jgi:HTH-type transcriptional regulator, transcriptional repressor of NAD biosynthesis genes
VNRRHLRALVVGKFSPLHRGHEALLERAAAESRELVIVSYAKPERQGCEAARRRSWLSERFPKARVLVVDPSTLASVKAAPPLPDDDADERTHRRFVGFLCLEVLGCTVDAVYTSEAYGDGFAAELTRYFAEHGYTSPVEHVSFDPARSSVPIAASTILRAPHAHRAFLSRSVYASFVERVALLGGESSGKTTLALALARRFETAFVAEYGRTLWEERHGHLVFSDMLDIAQRQIALEDSAAKAAHRYLFCDTTPLVTRLYSQVLFGRVDGELEVLARRVYATTIVCAPDFAFQQDGTRRDAAFRAEQHETTLKALENLGHAYEVVGGSLDDRVRQVEAILDRAAVAGRSKLA